MRWLLCGCLCLIVGCSETSPERGNVSGQVQLNGKPLPEGTIRFIPEQSTPGAIAFARISAGAYRMEGETAPVIGKYRVEIEAMGKTGEKEPAPDSPPGTLIEVERQYLPEKYNARTTLTAEIKSGSNQHDFKLATR